MASLKIATFNANSLRARLSIVTDWLDKEKPDVLALQETKVQDKDFPGEAFESKGWKTVFRGKNPITGWLHFKNPSDRHRNPAAP